MFLQELNDQIIAEARSILGQGYLLYLVQHNKFLPCFPLGPLLHAGYFNAGLAREFIPRLS